MKPVVPRVSHEGARFFEIGLGQEQYGVLPAYRDGQGLVMTEWVFTPDERAAIAGGAGVRLWVHVGEQAMPPVSLEVAGA